MIILSMYFGSHRTYIHTYTHTYIHTYYIHTYIHVRTQYSVDPGQPPPLSYTSSEPISNIFTFLESLEFIWSAVFFEFRKLKTPFWAKKQKHTEFWRGSTFCVRLL